MRYSYLLTAYGVQYALATPLSTYPVVGPRQGSTMNLAPVITPATPHLINSSYIVMLKPGVDSQSLLMHFDFLQSAHSESPLDGDDGGLKHVYDGPKTKGYSGAFSEMTVERIRAQPEVDYIEQDQTVWAYGLEVQNNAPWGLARISHREKLGFQTFRKYQYDPSGGEGVDAYVIDTGININHVEFEGRARWGKTMPANDVDEDGNGHGTHCAGTMASGKYGVAKKANLIAVKVLGSNGSGSMSDVVGGVVWASDQASKAAAKARAEYAATGYTTHKGSVANMSLGGGKSKALDAAVNAAVEHGMHFAVAAGNDNKDACNYSPAAAEKAVTVGASTIGDERAYFSNYGTCVDVFAPGLNILSTWTGSKTATNTISGTSMASPHTAGLLAYYLSLYPSKSFDPTTSTFDFEAAADFFSMASSTTNEYPIAGLSTFVTFAKSMMPSWLAKRLAVQEASGWVDTYQPGDDVASVPETLSPKTMKKAILTLATSGKLTDVGSGSPNLLIFNNATALA
ncbi:hypothetical protein M408DRAFT_329847 [Serendipita vermifera MAFF 305830]|uniref:Peptidase S8/S53 domain-containing protein n=1 Tax=Serendipita vermifera MAFF 305830 TaxID=933852 RepID=A0A0C3B708_SERVB|nr:hypothetical protein M408DRAFT_331504 [Serendipita vermifera MAFF 305830]KIM27939.1 hypothetical protein M408DRAFT_329847 [Serendipita vermifera MAFF 305830]